MTNEPQKPQNSSTPDAPVDAQTECEKKRDEYLAGWQRAKADFINYKKEEIARLEHISRYANEGLLRDLIAVVDSFELGLAALEKAGPVEKGVYMIKAQIEDLLKRSGVTRIQVDIGAPLNPEHSEAIAEVISSQPPGTVVEEVEAGYRLHEKIIRPARVKVAKNK